MKPTHLLIDLENVQPDPDHVRIFLAESGAAWVFHSVNQRKLLPPLQAIGDRVTLVPTSRPGKNSLDFHLVFYLGYLASRNNGRQKQPQVIRNVFLEKPVRHAARSRKLRDPMATSATPSAVFAGPPSALVDPLRTRRAAALKMARLGARACEA